MEAGAKQPTVSVIIPVYNAGAYLSECLSAVRRQTYADWELILIDDGSTDGSADVCDAAAAEDARIRVMHQPNGGVSRARNAGLDAASGKYIAFVDADDVILPTYLEKLVGAAETYGMDLALCGFVRFRGDQTKEYLFSRSPIGLYPDLPSFLQVYAEGRTNMLGVCVWAKLYSAEIIKRYDIRFDPEISYEEDCAFNIDYFSHMQTAVTVGEYLYRYRQMDVSLSKSYRKDTFRFLVNGFQRRCALLKQNGREDLIPRQEAVFLSVVITTAMKIMRSGLPYRERIEEYRLMMAYPESQRAVRKENRSESFFVNRIAASVRKKAPRRLSLILRLWDIADRALHKIRKRKNG